MNEQTLFLIDIGAHSLNAIIIVVVLIKFTINIFLKSETTSRFLCNYFRKATGQIVSIANLLFDNKKIPKQWVKFFSDPSLL